MANIIIHVHNKGAYTTVQAILVHERLQQLCGDSTVHFVSRLDTPHFSYTITYMADAVDSDAAAKVRGAVTAVDALKGVEMAPHTTAFLTVTCDT